METKTPRRSLLRLLAATPLAAAAGAVAARAKAAAGAARPAASGTSTANCAFCGGSAHSMLDCDQAPEVL